MSIKVIVLEHARDSNQVSSSLKSDTVSRQAVFNSFSSYDSKQDDVTTDSHSNHIMELLHNRNVLITNNRTICEVTDGCAEQY